MYLDKLMMAVFIITGIQLMRGKWLMLIAGYNTMGKEQRAAVNGKKLGQAVGGLLIYTAAMIFVGETFSVPEWLMVVGIIVPVGFLIAYVNLSPRFKN